MTRAVKPADVAPTCSALTTMATWAARYRPDLATAPTRLRSAIGQLVNLKSRTASLHVQACRYVVKFSRPGRGC